MNTSVAKPINIWLSARLRICLSIDSYISTASTDLPKSLPLGLVCTIIIISRARGLDMKTNHSHTHSHSSTHTTREIGYYYTLNQPMQLSRHRCQNFYDSFRHYFFFTIFMVQLILPIFYSIIAATYSTLGFGNFVKFSMLKLKLDCKLHKKRFYICQCGS